MKRTIIALLAATLLCSACYNEGQLMENPAPLMQYQSKPTEARLLAVAKGYAQAINSNLEKQTPHPGLYAEYGVTLAKLGCLQQANTMFNNERLLFPNSTTYIDILKQTLVPTLAAVTLCDTSRIDTASLDTIRISYTPEEIALQNQINNDPEYQRMLKQQMKEEREQQALAKKEAQKEKAKQKKAEQKAKAKQKKADQKAKEQAKKAALKEREKEKAAAEKAKQQAKKDAAKAKEQAKKDAEKAKADEQRAQEQMRRDAEKAQQEAARQAEKAQKEAEKAQQKAAREAEKAQQEAEKAQQEAEKAHGN